MAVTLHEVFASDRSPSDLLSTLRTEFMGGEGAHRSYSAQQALTLLRALYEILERQFSRPELGVSADKLLARMAFKDHLYGYLAQHGCAPTVSRA